MEKVQICSKGGCNIQKYRVWQEGCGISYLQGEGCAGCKITNHHTSEILWTAVSVLWQLQIVFTRIWFSLVFSAFWSEWNYVISSPRSHHNLVDARLLLTPWLSSLPHWPWGHSSTNIASIFMSTAPSPLVSLQIVSIVSYTHAKYESASLSSWAYALPPNATSLHVSRICGRTVASIISFRPTFHIMFMVLLSSLFCPAAVPDSQLNLQSFLRRGPSKPPWTCMVQFTCQRMASQSLLPTPSLDTPTQCPHPR